MSTDRLWRDTNPLSTRDILPLGPPEEAPAFEGRDNQAFNEARDTRRNVEINVGKECNNKCVFCIDGMPSDEDRSYMPIDEMKAEITRWAEAGSRSLGFLGGEPTIYKHLVEAVAHARDAGFTRIAVATNANKLRREKYVDALIEAGLTRVTISIHGHTAQLEDRLTRVPGQFVKKVAAMRLLKQKQLEGHLPDGVSVNIVLNGWNYKFLPQMMKFFYEDVGFDDIRANFMRPEGYAEGNAELSAPLTKAVPYLMKAILLNEYHFDKTFTFGGFPLCVLPKKLRDSEPLLKKYMGEYRDLSTDCSIRKDGPGFGIEEVDDATQRSRFNWQERKRYDLKSAVDACRSCSKVQLCEGIWNGYLHIHGDGEFRSL